MENDVFRLKESLSLLLKLSVPLGSLFLTDAVHLLSCVCVCEMKQHSRSSVCVCGGGGEVLPVTLSLPLGW